MISSQGSKVPYDGMEIVSEVKRIITNADAESEVKRVISKR